MKCACISLRLFYCTLMKYTMTIFGQSLECLSIISLIKCRNWSTVYCISKVTVASYS